MSPSTSILFFQPCILDCIRLKVDVYVCAQYTTLMITFVKSWYIMYIDGSLLKGIVGSINSGKSALVHRYLTGSYMQEESPEGIGRLLRCYYIIIDNEE